MLPDYIISHPPSMGTTRAVWAEVTRNPTARLADIGRAVGKSRSHVYASLRILEDLGYIRCDWPRKCARVVLVPLRVGPLVIRQKGEP